MKLPYHFFTKEKINQWEIQLDKALKYVPEVNEYPGSYKREGSGSLQKKAENKG